MTLTECAGFLLRNDRYLVLTHRRPDGDALGSAAALCLCLQTMGKTCLMLENPETTDRYLTITKEFHAPADYRPDTVVSVDLAEEGILQMNGGPWAGGVDLSIDHHPSNSGYAKERLLDPEAAACGEILYALFKELGVMNARLAELLYIAVTTDTGCFRYKNTTPNTLRVGAALLEAGAPIDLNRTLFMKKRRSRLELEGRIIESLEYFEDGEACIGTVRLADLSECGTTEADMEDIASVSGQVEGVELSITLRETASDRWKVSVRTGRYANANAVCSEFGGGGHGMAAGCTLEGPEDEVRRRLKDAVRKHWKTMPL